MPGPALDGGPPRAVRTVVATVLTGWTVLQVVTLVVAAGRREEANLVGTFFFTGLLTLGLAAASVVAWRWRARANPVWLHLHDEGTDPEPSGPAAEGGPGAPPGRQRHRSLSGEQEPPRRW